MSPIVSKLAKAPVKLGCSLALNGQVNANVRASTSLSFVVTKRHFSSQLGGAAAVERTGGCPIGMEHNLPPPGVLSQKIKKPDAFGVASAFGDVASKPVDFSYQAFNTAAEADLQNNDAVEAECGNELLSGKGQVVPFGAPKDPCGLRNRPYIPCSGDTKLPELVPSATADFPHRVVLSDNYRATAAVEDFAEFAREYYDEYLTQHGCVAFSNTPIRTVKDYNRFVTMLGYRTMSYLHYMKFMNARSMQSTQVEAAVRTASDEPGDYCIEPHCEYHTAGLPKKISLWCDSPSQSQGESLLSDNRKIFQELSPEVREKFRELGCEYEVYYPSKKYAEYNHWEGNISCDKAKVEEYLESQGYTWEWEAERDALRYKKTIPAIHEHDETGEECWFNQIAAHHWTFYEGHPRFRQFRDQGESFKGWPVTSRYGDGSPIEDSTLAHIRQVVWRNTVAVDLQHGDIVLCDNYLVKHGRMPYPKEDKSRKVYVSVAYD